MCNLKRDPNMWIFFDGSKDLEGASVGYILNNPNGKKFMIACRLELQCTNNIVEYEALLQELRKVIDLKANKIKVFGDSDIVIRQVRNTIHCLSSHLKHYHHDVWEFIKSFDAFNISLVPRSFNFDVDLLANVASRLIPSKNLLPNTFFMEFLYRPSIPDNVTNWRVFDDDKKIIEIVKSIVHPCSLR
jgi:ribonuclease HI